MTTALTRLHISPFTPELLDSVLAPSARSQATDISFHTIATFPENNYGYVSLPPMEADKLKKKLNGSILKGKKFKVEAARLDPKTARTVEDDEVAGDKKEKKKKSSKRKAEDNDDGVLDGYELPSGRHVKRGWTEPASSRKHKKQKKGEKKEKEGKLQAKSKYTESAECLFKTKTPPSKTVTGKKDKKVRKDNKSPNEVVVHEFAQTVTHPSFLKSAVQGNPLTAGFEEGIGWVDEEGNVQEAPREKTRKETYKPGKKDGAKERVTPKKKTSERHSIKKAKSPTPVSTDESEEGKEKEPDWTSSSGSSDSEDSESGDDTDSESDSDISESEGSVSNEKHTATKKVQMEKPVSENASSPENPKHSERDDASDDSSESSASSDEAAEVKENDVHPLEALFKRPQSNNTKEVEPNTGFSFFGGNDDDIEGESEDEQHQLPITEPLTPYTRRDRQVRGIRSAAPTPDTALHSHTRLLAEADEDMEDVDDDSSLLPIQLTPSKAPGDSTGAQEPQETDFAKWFWVNRGDNNRAWKKRRRDAAKEKRQRENRRKGMKGRG
ncbi:hypothetical protein BGW36DRAFT_60293 [Talaromyces proteolyticus]|uniref:Uncharacterized protein n=1 Tax=Talaromyces proteolyticus TaxID=1131652 RepID=A0AAD4KL08_9EURO|nr:uncharacterized protein BGW36DRAFT_60293 [Talaromyces proteolyticus]KAH8690823.1 hypothetical protein BGW36DRAFT_60293 [Talaromyces proteolyticus]